jgi:carbon monoxide dehydrogenase subunit G
VARFELTETVGQPPQVAWDYFVDPDNTPKWNSNVSQASIDGEPRVGGTITTKASFLGVKIDGQSAITECEPPNRYRFVSEKPFKLDLAMDFEGVDDGTRITMTAEVDPGSLFPIGGRLLTRQIERTLKKDVATLARNIDAL